MLDLIRAKRRSHNPPTHDLFDRVSLKRRATLFDLDDTWRMSNASYLKFMTRGRLEHTIASGLLKQMLAQQCRIIVANSEITYIKSFALHQEFYLRTRLLGWDEKYFYYDQRFDTEDTLHTHALLRCVPKHESTLLTPRVFLEMAGFNRLSPALPEYIDSWKVMLKDKKRYSFPG